MPHFERALELDPQYRLPHHRLSALYESAGELQKALAVQEQFLRAVGADVAQSSTAGGIYAKMGRLRDAMKVLTNVTRSGSKPGARSLALLYFTPGERDRCLEWLTKAFERENMTGVNVDPLYDGLRSAPRFQSLLRQLGLPSDPRRIVQ